MMGLPEQRRSKIALALVLGFTVLTALAGYLQKSPCLSSEWNDYYQYRQLCYSDIYPLYYAEGLAAGAVPYRDHPVEYPVLIGATMLAASNAVKGEAPQHRPVAFYQVTALMLAAAFVVVSLSTLALSGRRRFDAIWVAASPVAVLYAFYNWDLAAMAFAAVGMEAWRRRKPALAGVLFGLGAATKIYPAFLLVALLPLCLRANRGRVWLTAATAAVAAWAVVNVPILLLYRDGWLRFFTLSRERTSEIDTFWYQLAHVTRNAHGGAGKVIRDVVNPALAEGQAPSALNLASLLLLLALWSGIGYATWRAPVRPRVPQVAFLLVVAFLLANKVWSPQYCLWYVPLAVLARPRWRMLLALQIADCVVMVGALSYLLHLGNGQGWSEGPFFAAIWIRNLVLIAFAGLVIRDMYRPDQDVVRADGVDDPAGGVLDGAQERARGPRVLPRPVESRA